jgi:hypothetical protein
MERMIASATELESALCDYLKIYNNNIPQLAFNHMTQIQALKEWQKKKPELFVNRVYNQAGLDNSIGPIECVWLHADSVNIEHGQ